MHVVLYQIHTISIFIQSYTFNNIYLSKYIYITYKYYNTSYINIVKIVMLSYLKSNKKISLKKNEWYCIEKRNKYYILNECVVFNRQVFIWHTHMVYATRTSRPNNIITRNVLKLLLFIFFLFVKSLKVEGDSYVNPRVSVHYVDWLFIRIK